MVDWNTGKKWRSQDEESEQEVEVGRFKSRRTLMWHILPSQCSEIITNFKIATALEYSVAESLIQEAINIDIQSIIHRITNV